MKTVVIQAEKRPAGGKKATKEVRKQGMVPCVLYGGDDVIHFQAAPIAFRPVIYSADFKIIKLEIDGQEYDCILKDAQFHPVTDELLHVDLLRLIKGHPVKVSLPIRTKGTAEGVKDGGIMQVTMRTVDVKTLPEHLTDEVLVDVTSLKLGGTARVKDLEMPDGIELMTSPATPVATVQTPRSLKMLELSTEPAVGDLIEGEEEAEAATEEEVAPEE